MPARGKFCYPNARFGASLLEHHLWSITFGTPLFHSGFFEFNYL
jgi:hypothetical protein